MLKYFSLIRILALWNKVNSSFWFVPGMMCVGAVGLSFLLVQIDTRLDIGTTSKFGFLFTFQPEGARSTLSVIASSMITVASLIFSITMLSLQLASSQFGPRVLGNFMRDRSNQIVLGTFVATFLYCLLVIRTVWGTSDAGFVPHISVTFAVFLAAVSVGILIYFIHHIATAIRIETLLANLAIDACAAVDRIFPEKLGHGPAQDDAAMSAHRPPEDFERNAGRVDAWTGGYVQNIGIDELMQVAVNHDLILKIEAPPGRFVTRGQRILTVYPQDRLTDAVADSLGSVFVIGRNRTVTQDLEFSIHRIVELAQRALSPGMNDPTTALYCIDRLGEVMDRLADRDIPSPTRLDEDGRLRILTETVSVGGVACNAFAAVARYGVIDVDVITRLIDTMDHSSRSFPPTARDAVMTLREQIFFAGTDAVSLNFDRKALRELRGAM